MEKLTIKELAGYLPYGLKAFCVRTNEVRDVTLLHFTYDLKTVGLNHLLYEGLIVEPHKPILRPLSDLTKEITHNGETFVPMQKLKDENVSNIEFSLNQLWLDQITSAKISILQCWMLQNILFEWHFDVHGLIEKGLAINMNELEQNPYK